MYGYSDGALSSWRTATQNPSPGRRGAGVRCSQRNRWLEPDHAVSARGTGRSAYTSPCPLLTGEGSPRLCFTRNGLQRGQFPNRSPPPKPGLCSSPSRPNEGLREASRGRAGERCPWRQSFAGSRSRLRRSANHFCDRSLLLHHGGISSVGAGTPVQPDATHGESSQENRGAGFGQWPVALPRHFDIDIRHAAVDCDAALTPRPPSDGVQSQTSRR